MKKTMPIRLRKAEEGDIGFIFNSWLKSYRGSMFAKTMTNTTYYTEHHKVVEKILKHHPTVIACNEEDPTQVYGYINAGYVDGIFCLNYIYIKHTYRNLGIGKALLNAYEHDPSQASVYTHHTKMAERLAAKYNMVHHPYIYINGYMESQPETVEESNEEDSKSE